VEYNIIASAQRAENFSVLLASDSLLDIMAGAASFYKGGPFRNAVVEEEYFVNLYDYREYMPNFKYEATKDPEDRDTINTVFTEKDLILSFYALRKEKELNSGAFARGDWLEDMGKTNADIKTFDDIQEMLLFFKIEKRIDTPTVLTQTIDPLYEWVAFDTYPCCNGINTQYVVDGKVKLSNVGDNDRELMTMISTWYSEGLIDPNWSSYTSIPDFDEKLDTGELGYLTGSRPTTMQGHNMAIPAGEKYGWVGIAKPVRTEGQTLHMGFQVNRIYWGSASISSKCANIPLACTWLDWRYSEEGSFLYGYGVQGVSWDYDENGEIVITDFIVNHKAYWSMAMTTYALNSLSEPGLYINYTWKVPGNEAALQYLADWNTVPHDNAYVYPSGITFTDEQNGILTQYGADVASYLSENYLAFVDGSKPLSEWDSYVQGVNAIGLDKILAVYQEAYDDFMAE
jgi:putative aldouronate transport system substrate-binding protein